MREKRWKLLIISFVISILVLCIIPVVIIQKDVLVVQYGIREYRTIRMASIIGSIVIAVLSPIIALRINIVKSKKLELEFDNKLLEDVLAELTELMELSKTKKWKYEFESEVAGISADVGSVINYYKELGDEIKNEDLVDLVDARGVLVKVLQAMLHYLKQTTRVLKVMSPKDVRVVREEITKHRASIGDMQKNAQEFTMSVLKYIEDKDGDSKEAFEYMSSYKEVILGEVSLIDKYLKEGDN